MFSRCLALSAALLSLIASTSASYDANAKTNIAVYYGQGPNEDLLGLQNFCENGSVDIIPLAFMDIYEAQGNGYPGTNFAFSCSNTTYTTPGYGGVNNQSLNSLLNDCPTLVSGIPYCQAQGIKILLSLGGATNTYQLTSEDDAIYLAQFLWGAFGPKNASANWPRPFDTQGTVNEVDGFDFDIENTVTGEQAYYVTLINTLRSYFPTAPGSKEYLITGAPQCLVPDANMSDMINLAQFDILFVQEYNTPACSARNWVDANPNYAVTEVQNPSGFNNYFTALESSLAGGQSTNAKLYFGLMGSTAAGTAGDYLDPATEIAPLVEAYFCDSRFGGIMIWEAAYSENNTENGMTFHERVKDILLNDSTNTTAVTCSATSTTTASGTPTPTPCCTKSYTVVSGDYCYEIASNNGIDVATLEALNPVLGNDVNVCDIFPGQVLCLAQGSCSTTSSTTTTSTSSSGTPTPTSCCTETYTVVSGDYCYEIASNNGIDVATLEALNPVLGSDVNACDIFPGQVLCVAQGSCSTTSTISSTTTTSTSSSGTTTSTSSLGTATSTSSSGTTTSTSSSGTTTPTSCCTKTYTVVSGDYCYEIASNNGIDVATLEALNPVLGNDINVCDIYIGQVLCLAAGSCSTTSTKSSTTSTTSTTTTNSSLSSSSPVTTTSSSSATPTPLACNADNCLRQFSQSPSVTAFCATYTATMNTVSTDLPTFVSQCSGNPSRVSSACSCIVTSPASTTSSAPVTSLTSPTPLDCQADNCLRQFSQSPSVTAFCATYTATMNTVSTGLPTFVSQCSGNPSRVSSACSCIVTSMTSSTTTTPSSSTTATSTLVSTTSSAPVTSLTSSSTTASSSSTTATSTSSSTTATSTLVSTTSSAPVTSLTSSSTTTSSSSTTATSTSSSSINSATVSSSSTSSPNSFMSFNNSTTTSATTTSSTVILTSSSAASSAAMTTTSVTPSTTSVTTTSASPSTTSVSLITTTTTSVYTITSCPPTVTNCPLGHVTTEIVTITTTFCPATTTPTYPSITPSPTEYTTSTVYTTLIYTITSCAPTVTNCPAKLGSVTTETRFLYTTVCPVSIPTPTTPGLPQKEISVSSATSSTTTLSSTTTKYLTVVVPNSSSSSVIVVVQTMNVVPVPTPSSSVVSSVTPNAAQFTGGAAETMSLGFGMLMAVVLCMVGWAVL